MNKTRRFSWLSLVTIGLLIFFFLVKTDLALAVPYNFPNRTFNTQQNLLGFQALPLQYRKVNEFSECTELDRFPHASIIPNLGNLHFKVSTVNPEAQKFFDQGMTLFYGFNDEDAMRSFQEAARLDANLAMAYYGMALAAGTNINIDITGACENFAYNSIQKARSFSVNAAPIERDLISALAKRYTNNPNPNQQQLSIAYKNAMAKVYARYRDNPDVAVIYADTLMDLHPWKQWKPDGKPTSKDTLTLVEVLEKALIKAPKHVGVNHYYIHAMEGSAQAKLALNSANILTSLAPAAGHIAHMPSHIYARLGDYDNAAKVNENAVNVDKPYVKQCIENIYSRDCEELYVGHYNSHDLLFLAVSYAMAGRSSDALQTADEITQFVPKYIKDQPGLIHYMPSKILMLERFGRWDDILSLPSPKETSASILAFWHWSRAMAYLGKKDVNLAKAERDEFIKSVKSIPSNHSWGNNTAQDIFKITSLVLDAKIADENGKNDAAVKFLKRAVKHQDSLVYDEPIPLPPVREALGAALYSYGRYSKAEQVFREDVMKTERTANPKNGRSLFGLYESLKAQGKTKEAQSVKVQFDTAWKNADVELKMSDLF